MLDILPMQLTLEKHKTYYLICILPLVYQYNPYNKIKIPTNILWVKSSYDEEERPCFPIKCRNGKVRRLIPVLQKESYSMFKKINKKNIYMYVYIHTHHVYLIYIHTHAEPLTTPAK